MFKVFIPPEVAAVVIDGVFKAGFLKLLPGSVKLSNPITGELSVVPELSAGQEASFRQTTASLSARNCSDTDPAPTCVQQSW